MNNDEQGFLMFVKLILMSWFFVWAGAIAGEQVYVPKIKELNQQSCYIKIVIEEQGNTVVKKEILECADGRKNFDTPGYWELYSEFYYRDTNTPEYCREYSRPNHAFKTFGTVCLDKNGKWEVK
tara:strand:- start:278 stop:649 length:372 start_codon:yes stop_codon:yes gene_type:complete